MKDIIQLSTRAKSIYETESTSPNEVTEMHTSGKSRKMPRRKAENIHIIKH